MNFNFSSIQPTTTNRSLKPYTITKVKFAGCSVQDIVGKKDPSKTYKTLVTRFESEFGNYEEHTFFPNDKSAERPTFTNQQGHEYQRPSNWEQLQGFIAQLIDVIGGQEAIEKFKKVSEKFTSFDDVCKVLVKLTDPHKGEEFYLKLTGRNSNGTVYARIPNIMALNKKGELFTADNFISKQEGVLGFSAYEEQQKNAVAQAKPTEMSKIDEEKPANVDDLLNDL